MPGRRTKTRVPPVGSVLCWSCSCSAGEIPLSPVWEGAERGDSAGAVQRPPRRVPCPGVLLPLPGEVWPVVVAGGATRGFEQTRVTDNLGI